MVQTAIRAHRALPPPPQQQSASTSPQHTQAAAADSGTGCSTSAEGSGDSTGGSSTESLSFIDFQPEQYDQLLAVSSSTATQQFRQAGLLPEGVQCEVHPSAPTHYRLRCGFGIFDPECADEWRLTVPDSMKCDQRLRYVYWDEEKVLVPLAGDCFAIASTTICEAMPKVLQQLRSTPVLRRGIRSAKFLSTLTGQLLVTLVYKHRTLLEEAEAGSTWHQGAAQLSSFLGDHCKGVIGRSKGVKQSVGQQFVTERGIILSADASRQSAKGSSVTSAVRRSLVYHQPDEAFSNPNGGMAIHTLNWLCSCTDTVRQQRAASANGSAGGGDLGDLDLLELYCGNGNHTMAMATVFDKVLAVEINPQLVEAGNHNAALNGAINVKFLCVNAAYFSRNILGSCKWTDKVGGADYNFDVVLVDPPRAGLDAHTCRKIATYGHILYISCNPEALRRDMQMLQTTHETVRFAFFDHFPYTKHIECGVLLARRCDALPPPPPPKKEVVLVQKEQLEPVVEQQLEHNVESGALGECDIFDDGDY